MIADVPHPGCEIRLPPPDSVTTAGEAFRVTLPTPHGDYLVVDDPDSLSYFIIEPYTPGMRVEEFTQMSVLEILPDTLLGVPSGDPKQFADRPLVPWVPGVSRLRVFHKPGSYHLQVGEHLETGCPEYQKIVHITYAPTENRNLERGGK